MKKVREYLKNEEIKLIPILYTPKKDKLICRPLTENQIKVYNPQTDLYNVFWHHWNRKTMTLRCECMAIFFKKNGILGIALDTIGTSDTCPINIIKQIQLAFSIEATGVALCVNIANSDWKSIELWEKVFVALQNVFSSFDMSLHCSFVIGHRLEEYYYIEGISIPM